MSIIKKSSIKRLEIKLVIDYPDNFGDSVRTIAYTLGYGIKTAVEAISKKINCSFSFK